MPAKSKKEAQVVVDPTSQLSPINVAKDLFKTRQQALDGYLAALIRRTHKASQFDYRSSERWRCAVCETWGSNTRKMIEHLDGLEHASNKTGVGQNAIEAAENLFVQLTDQPNGAYFHDGLSMDESWIAFCQSLGFEPDIEKHVDGMLPAEWLMELCFNARAFGKAGKLMQAQGAGLNCADIERMLDQGSVYSPSPEATNEFQGWLDENLGFFPIRVFQLLRDLEWVNDEFMDRECMRAADVPNGYSLAHMLGSGCFFGSFSAHHAWKSTGWSERMGEHYDPKNIGHALASHFAELLGTYREMYEALQSDNPDAMLSASCKLGLLRDFKHRDRFEWEFDPITGAIQLGAVECANRIVEVAPFGMFPWAQVFALEEEYVEAIQHVALALWSKHGEVALDAIKKSTTAIEGRVAYEDAIVLVEREKLRIETEKKPAKPAKGKAGEKEKTTRGPRL